MLFLSVLRNRHEGVLSLSTLKWPFILLIFYYLQAQFFQTFKIWSTLQVDI